MDRAGSGKNIETEHWFWIFVHLKKLPLQESPSSIFSRLAEKRLLKAIAVVLDSGQKNLISRWTTIGATSPRSPVEVGCTFSVNCSNTLFPFFYKGLSLMPCCGSGSGLILDSMGFLDPDLNPGGKKWPTKKRKKLVHFSFLKCWMFSFEGWKLLL